MIGVLKPLIYDKFVYNLGDRSHIIADFSGMGKGSNPSAMLIFSLDTL